MTSEELQKAFEEAVEKINSHKEPFPADFLLRLYAYYKRANRSVENPKGKKPIINAFKANALLQIKNMSPAQAKKAYIEAVNNYFLYRK